MLKLHKKNGKVWQKFKFHEKPIDFKGRIGYADFRIKQKKGDKKAIVALARKLIVIIYTMLKQGTLFDESCFETRRKNCEQKQLSRYIRELEKHGYHVEAQS